MVEANTGKANAALAATQGNLQKTAATADKSAAASAASWRKAGASMQSFGKSWTRHVSLPIAAGGAAAVGMAVQFNDSMTKVSTQAGASRGEVKKLSAEVLKLAASGKSASSPNELAKALFHIESTGYRGAAAMKQLVGAEKLAAVGGSDLETTTNALVGVQKTHIKGTETLSKTMGVLNAIVGHGNLRMQDLASSMSSGVMVTAQQLGVNIKEVGAALDVMTARGINTNNAMTSLNMGMLRMATLTPKGAKALQSIGISSLELATTFRQKGLVAGFQLLADHLSKISKTKANQVLTDAFGVKSAKAIRTVVGNVGDLHTRLQGITQDAGNFNDKWKQTTQTPAFKLHAELSKLQAVMIRLGNRLLPIIIPLLQQIGDAIKSIIDTFNSLPKWTQSWIIKLGIAAVAFGPILTAIGTVIKAYGALRAAAATAAGVEAVAGGAGGATAAGAAGKTGLFGTAEGVAGGTAAGATASKLGGILPKTVLGKAGWIGVGLTFGSWIKQGIDLKMQSGSSDLAKSLGAKVAQAHGPNIPIINTPLFEAINSLHVGPVGFGKGFLDMATSGDKAAKRLAGALDLMRGKTVLLSAAHAHFLSELGKTAGISQGAQAQLDKFLTDAVTRAKGAHFGTIIANQLDAASGRVGPTFKRIENHFMHLPKIAQDEAIRTTRIQGEKWVKLGQITQAGLDRLIAKEQGGQKQSIAHWRNWGGVIVNGVVQSMVQGALGKEAGLKDKTNQIIGSFAGLGPGSAGPQTHRPPTAAQLGAHGHHQKGAVVGGAGSGDKVPLHIGGKLAALVEPGELISVANRKATDALMAVNSAIPRFAGGGQLPHPRLTGFGGQIGQEGQAGIDAVWRAAKADIARHRPKPGAGRGAPGGPKGVGSYKGLPMANWVIAALQFAASRGIAPQPTSGYRPGFDPMAPSGSEHAGTQYPHGAVDFGGMIDPAALPKKLSVVHATSHFKWPLLAPIGFRDDGHASGTGHMRGGIIARLAGGGAFGPGHYTVKGATASAQQKNTAAAIMNVIAQVHANRLASEAILMAATQESVMGAAGNTFQLTSAKSGTTPGAGAYAQGLAWMKTGFYGKGGGLSLSHKLHDPGAIAQAVEGSAFPSAYSPWKSEADRWIAGWTGKAVGAAGVKALTPKQKQAAAASKRKSALAAFMKLGATLGLTPGIQKQVDGLTAEIAQLDEFANNANSIGGPFKGKSEIQYLQTELDKMLRLRNLLIDALGVLQGVRDTLSKQLTRMQKEFDALKSVKSPSKAQTARKAALSLEIPNAMKGLKDLGTTIGLDDTSGTGILGLIAGLQGTGGPFKSMPSLGAVGDLGGTILTTQLALQQAGGSGLSTDMQAQLDLSNQLLRESNQRFGVSQAQYDVFKNFPPFGGSFATGGVVPGPVGAPMMIQAHGGETVSPVGSNIRVEVHDHRIRVFHDEKEIEAIVKKVNRGQVRGVGRTPGLPGSMRG